MSYILESIKIFPQIYAYKEPKLADAIATGTQSTEPGIWVGIVTPPDSDGDFLAWDLDPWTVAQSGHIAERAQYISLTPTEGDSLYRISLTDHQIYDWLSVIPSLAEGARTAFEPGADSPSLYWFVCPKSTNEIVVPYQNPNETDHPDYVPLPIRVRYCAHIQYYEESDPDTKFVKYYPDSTGVQGDTSKRAYEVVINAASPHLFTPEHPSLCVPAEITLYDSAGDSIVISGGEADIETIPTYVRVDFAMQGTANNNQTLDILMYGINTGSVYNEAIVEFPFLVSAITDWTPVDGSGNIIGGEYVYDPATAYIKSYFFTLPTYFSGVHSITPIIRDLDMNLVTLPDSAVEVTSALSGPQISMPGGSSYVYQNGICIVPYEIIPNSNTLDDIVVTVTINGADILSGTSLGTASWSSEAGADHAEIPIVGTLSETTAYVYVMTTATLAAALGIDGGNTIYAALLDCSLKLDCTITGSPSAAEFGPYYVGIGMESVEMSLDTFNPTIVNYNQWSKTSFSVRLNIPSPHNELIKESKLPPYLVKSDAIKISPVGSSGWRYMVINQFYCNALSIYGIADISRYSEYAILSSSDLTNMDVQAIPNGQYDVAVSLKDSTGVTKLLTKSVYITTSEPPIQMDAQPDTSEIDNATEFTILQT